MWGTGGPAGIRDSPLMYAGVGVLYLPTLHCDRYLASVGFMGKTADIVRPGTSASHPATSECAWGEDWHVLTGRVFDTTWPAGSGPRQVGQTSSPSLVPSSSRLPTGTTAGAALQDEDGPRLAGLRRPARPHQARGAHVSLTTAARIDAMVGAAVKTTRWRRTVTSAAPHRLNRFPVL